MVPGAISMSQMSPGSGSVVRVVVVIIGIIIRCLVRIIRVVSDHHVLSSDRGSIPFPACRRLLMLARHCAQLQRAAGGGDPRRELRGGGNRAITAADDDHGVSAAGRAGVSPGRSVLGASAQDAENLAVVLPCQPLLERTGVTCGVLSQSPVQQAAEEKNMYQPGQQRVRREFLHYLK